MAKFASGRIFAIVGLLVLVGLPFFGTGVASASIIAYDLNIDHCTGTCGSFGSSYGTVTLNDFGGTGDVQVDVTLATGNEFVFTGSADNGSTFSFNLLGDPAITVSGQSATWSLVSGTASDPAPRQANGYGDFDYTMRCCSPDSGGGAAVPSPLTFHVLSSGLTVASFAELSAGGHPSVYFATNLLGINGQAGFIAALDSDVICTDCVRSNDVNPLNGVAPVPEPASMLLVGSGLIGIAGVARRRLKSKK